MFVNGKIPEKLLVAAISNSGRGEGAQTCFVGRVRPDRKEGSEVEAIGFTAQSELATQVSQEIIKEAISEFSLLNVEVWHSLGIVKVGEPCFFVSVNGLHRKETFRALEYIVDEVKSRCPIFGKELLKDGGVAWKQNN